MSTGDVFELTLSKENFHFSSAHFCAHGSSRERLHGHNYSVSITVRGTASSDGFVVDFSELKAAVRALCG